MLMWEKRFKVGQIVHHRKFGYRGVIISIDENFAGTEDWYERVARSCPPKDRPWYHVLVDLSDAVTYAAESSLGTDALASPIQHPYLNHFFEPQFDGRYHRNERPWPKEDEGM